MNEALPLVSYTNIKNDADQIKRRQNRYCHYQKQNPHTPNVMKTLGLAEEDVDKFCTDMLFPKIV